MAAGLGFKTFTTGEVLTAGDVNGYLMQGVLVFATAAARNSAITSPQEGQFAFTKDTNGLWYYDGAAWVASGATGDIEGVTAGVGITGGGTSGTVTVTNDMATTITTAGDLIKGTGSGTYNRLGIGSTGQVLTVASGAPSWATPAGGGGKVLQVVQGTTTTSVQSSSSTFADTGLTATISPTLNTSKVLVLVAHPATAKSNGNAGNGVGMILYRDAVNLVQFSEYFLYTTSTALGVVGAISFNYLDSPATTGTTTYKTMFNNLANVAETSVQHAARMSTIILLEIGA